MNWILDLKAYGLKLFFNLFGRAGAIVLNFGRTSDLDVYVDLRYGSEAKQRLDVFRAKPAGSGGLPVLVYFHGGGWISADKKIYEGIAATFSRKGFVTFNVNYRLAPRHRFSAPLQDAALAMDWIHRNAAHFGGDGSDIVLAGDSAGAQIASWYVSALQKDHLFQRIGIRSVTRRVSVKGLLLFYGVYDFDSVLNARFPFIRVYARSFLGADNQAYAENSRLASPIKQVSDRLPPVWLCAGERDGLFTQSIRYAEELERCGVRCQTLFFPTEQRANHGFLFFRWLGSSKAAVTSAVDFLRDIAGVDC